MLKQSIDDYDQSTMVRYNGMNLHRLSSLITKEAMNRITYSHEKEDEKFGRAIARNLKQDYRYKKEPVILLLFMQYPRLGTEDLK